MPEGKIKRAGEKVLSTDVAQAVVAGTVDALEDVTVDKADSSSMRRLTPPKAFSAATAVSASTPA